MERGYLSHDGINFIGEKFGKLTILKHINKQNYLCKCDCGIEKKINFYCLRNGTTSSCGCNYKNDRPHRVLHNGTNYIGQKYNRWLILEFKGFRPYENNKSGHIDNLPMYLCKCDCGTKKIITFENLSKEHSKSCGCISNEIREKRLLPLGEATFNVIYKEYILGAKDRDLVFNLTKEQFKEITQQNCHYCGIPPNNIKISKSNRGDFIYNGIDRVDSSKGYSLDNCVPCCKHCNIMKMGYSLDDFLNKVKRICSNLNLFKE